MWRPLAFAGGQLFFLAPALLIAVPLLWPRPQAAATAARADAFDRRIVALLAFGPAASVMAVAALSGRGTVAMWGYPLWLYLGLWIVLASWTAIDRTRMARIVAVWGVVLSLFVVAFVADYLVLPSLDHRVRAVLFPGDRLAAELDTRFRDATGRPLAYVIGTMWDGGNAAHYSTERPQPRVLIDGLPRRAPWIISPISRPRAPWWYGQRAIRKSSLPPSRRLRPARRSGRRSICRSGGGNVLTRGLGDPAAAVGREERSRRRPRVGRCLWRATKPRSSMRASRAIMSTNAMARSVCWP